MESKEKKEGTLTEKEHTEIEEERDFFWFIQFIQYQRR